MTLKFCFITNSAGVLPIVPYGVIQYFNRNLAILVSTKPDVIFLISALSICTRAAKLLVVRLYGDDMIYSMPLFFQNFISSLTKAMALSVTTELMSSEVFSSCQWFSLN